MERHAPEESALRRKLLLYRVILGAVAVGLVVAALLRRPTPAPDIEVFDVSAQIDDLAREHPDWPDIVPPRICRRMRRRCTCI